MLPCTTLGLEIISCVCPKVNQSITRKGIETMHANRRIVVDSREENSLSNNITHEMAKQSNFIPKPQQL